MNILSIVTHENPSSIAVNYLGTSTQYIFKDGKKVAETIGENVKIICKFLGTKLEEIDIVAVVSGPGSYTGLRVGMAFAKSIVQFTNKKLFAVDAIEILKFKNENDGNIDVFPMIDARGGRCYVKENDVILIAEVEEVEKKLAGSFLVGSALSSVANRELTDQDILYASDLEKYVMNSFDKLENYNADEESLAKLLPIYVQDARIG